MIVMSDVSGTPRNPDRDPNDRDPNDTPDDREYHGAHAGGPHDPYNDDIADDLADDYDVEPVRGQLWRAFTEWVDDYAWTIIILGIALILMDVLAVLVVLLWQVRN
jgi:hypothetical protein